MDAFVSRKRRRLSPADGLTDEESTDMKLAMLLSLFPGMTQEALLDILTASDGSVETASSMISSQPEETSSRLGKRSTAREGYFPKIQTSLTSHIHPTGLSSGVAKKALTKKGQTLHLYSPEDIAAHTPCTIIHNFLPPSEADALLLELLDESKYFTRSKFQLFDRTVQSPHSHVIYVSTSEEHRQQTCEYKYGGSYRADVRQATPYMRAVSGKVQSKVNEEIQNRIRTHYPNGKKLQFQSSREWMPNAAFVNCYDGPSECVGFHSDELTYVGPRPVIGSLSLGVEREFRVRRVVPRDDDDDPTESVRDRDTRLRSNVREGSETNVKSAERENTQKASDVQGQIAIHLPHNSLLVMHAEMQEEWKHAIVPAQTILPHPLSGNRRINITYRWYRESLHPRHTPRCECGSHAILRCVQRKKETRGRYMWMCYAGYVPGKKPCSFFQWAEFDDDGEPIWEKKTNNDAAPNLLNFVEIGTPGDSK